MATKLVNYFETHLVSQFAQLKRERAISEQRAG